MSGRTFIIKSMSMFTVMQKKKKCVLNTVTVFLCKQQLALKIF